MPKPNEALADFFSDNRIFADLFNAFAFQGKDILHAEELQSADTSYVTTVERAGGVEKIGRYRDIIRKTTCGADFVILGIEPQNKIHYAMPVRAMLYDVLSYVTECRLFRKTQEKNQWTADEYLSGLTKGTCLTPVFTLVFYTGEDVWDGPRSLYDMLSIEEGLKPFVSDYSMNLIDVGHMSEKLLFRTSDLQELFHILPEIYSGSGRTDQTICSGPIVSLAGILTGSKKLYEIGKKGEIMMCRVLDELEMKGKKEGKREGKKLGERQAELRFSKLGQALERDGRMAELGRAFCETDYRKKLYLEYKIN